MFQVYLTIFKMLDIVGMFALTRVHFGINRILVQVDTFIYIKAYSEPRAYPGIFRTVDRFS